MHDIEIVPYGTINPVREDIKSGKGKPLPYNMEGDIHE
jgi:hypothetical protein